MNIEEDFRFDVRIQQRLMKKGLVKNEELEARLAGLKDLQEEIEIIDIEQPGVSPPVAEEVEPEAP